VNSWLLWLWVQAAWSTPLPEPDGIYLVMVDRFANGDPNNDADANPADPIAFHGGDLAGIEDRLDHIQSLGLRTVWLTPITQMRDHPIGGHSAAHGYWVEDGTALEPRFGTAADLEKLRNALDARGMRLVLDIVTNHVAPDAPLTRSHPDWFHTNGDITDWGDPHQRVYNDVHGLPDLAQELPAVRSHLIDQGLHWIDQARPDGFRIDAVAHLHPGFLAVYTEQMRKAAGDHFQLLGEFFDGNPVRVADTARATGLTHTFDFPLHYALIDAICTGGDLRKLATVLSSDGDYPAGHSHLTFVDNHDTARIASTCGQDDDRVRDVLRLLLALRGTPVITWGTEAGLSGTEEIEARASMDFSQRTGAHTAIQMGMALRKTHPALDQGSTRILSAGPDHISLVRTLGRDRVLVQVGADPSGLRHQTTALYADSGRVWIGAIPADASIPAAPTDPSATVELTLIPSPETPGEPVWITGSRRALGGWDPGRSIGPIGKAPHPTIAVEPGTMLAMKPIRIGPDGTVQWLSEADHFVWIPEDARDPIEVVLPNAP